MTTPVAALEAVAADEINLMDGSGRWSISGATMSLVHDALDGVATRRRMAKAIRGLGEAMLLAARDENWDQAAWGRVAALDDIRWPISMDLSEAAHELFSFADALESDP